MKNIFRICLLTLSFFFLFSCGIKETSKNNTSTNEKTTNGVTTKITTMNKEYESITITRKFVDVEYVSKNLDSRFYLEPGRFYEVEASSDELKNVNLTSSDTSMVEVDGNYLICKKYGEVIITITSIYNSNESVTINLKFKENY